MFVDNKNLFCWLFCTLFGIAQSGLVDSIEPCSVVDSDCLTRTYQKILTASGDGIPEIGMEPTDPFILKNVSATVLNLITLTMIDGTAKGVKSCVVHKAHADLEARNFTIDVTCSMVIKGKYRVTSNPGVRALIGGDVFGEGLGKVEVEKINIKVGFEFFARRGDDGELYYDYSYEGMKFGFSFGKCRFYANSLYIAGQDMVKPVVQMLNSNWRFFLTNFGRPFVKLGVDILFKYTHMWYDNVPANKYVIEDISPLLEE